MKVPQVPPPESLLQEPKSCATSEERGSRKTFRRSYREVLASDIKETWTNFAWCY
jgi:hypothetical protein